MSKKLDRVEFELLAHTDVMVQMIRNKLVVTDHMQMDHCESLQDAIAALDPIMQYLSANAQGIYYCYVCPVWAGQVTMYFEHAIDRANIIELLKSSQ